MVPETSPASRLTALPRPVAVDALKVSPAAFRRLGEQVLVTGEGGDHVVLSPRDFERFLQGQVVKDEVLWKDLQAKGFVKDHLDFKAVARKTLDRRLLVWAGPNVFRIAVTARRRPDEPGPDMSLETARAAVDWAFAAPAGSLKIEVAGGEPLLNWPAAAFIVRYARLRAGKSSRTLALTLATDALALDEEKFSFLAREKVGLRLTLDGPADLHDALRAAWGGADFAASALWLKRALEAASGEHEGFVPKPEVRCRVAKRSLGQAARIVDEFIRLGLETVSFEFVDAGGRLGAAGEPPASPEEFVAFWRQAFDHLVRADLKGKRLKESRALMVLRRILTGEQWAYPEREPLDRVAFDPVGAICLFDEGAELEGPEMFRVGNVGSMTFNAALASPAARAALTASQLEGQPLCSQCAYRPYCGLDPGAALQSQGTLWARMTDNERCRVYMGVFDHLFQRAQEWEVREKLFPQWLK